MAQVILTGEPVYVWDIRAGDDDQQLANITRPVVTPGGIEYRTEQLAMELLETAHAQAKRIVEMEGFFQELRMEAENKRFALSPAAKQVLREQQMNLNLSNSN